MVLFAMLFLALFGQLFSLQVIRAEELQQRAQGQWTSESVIAPKRGSIFDRNGMPLAMSATAYTASVSPRQVKNAQLFSETIAPVLNMEVSTVFKAF